MTLLSLKTPKFPLAGRLCGSALRSQKGRSVDHQYVPAPNLSRAYVLQKEKIKLNVNACVRLPEPVELEKVKAPIAPPPAAPSRQGPQRVARPQQQLQPPAPPPQKPGREKPRFLVEPKHNEILASLASVRL